MYPLLKLKSQKGIQVARRELLAFNLSIFTIYHEQKNYKSIEFELNKNSCY